MTAAYADTCLRSVLANVQAQKLLYSILYSLQPNINESKSTNRHRLNMSSVARWNCLLPSASYRKPRGPPISSSPPQPARCRGCTCCSFAGWLAKLPPPLFHRRAFVSQMQSRLALPLRTERIEEAALIVWGASVSPRAVASMFL
jgi:hypothetical protein